MKRYIILLGFVILYSNLFSQVEKTKQNEYDVNFETSQNDAMFPGGNDSMMIYIWNKINYPEDALKNNVEGVVQISFDVNFDGKIKNIEALTDFGYKLEDELIRVVKTMPDWIPASINGIKVRQQFLLSFPINRYNVQKYKN